MKSYYESFRESSELLIFTPNLNFNPHYHNNVEIYLIKGNDYQMRINDQVFDAGDGSIVIVDSYDVHGYKRISDKIDDSSRIMVIPYNFLSYFNEVKCERRIKNPHVKNKLLCEKLICLIDEHILTATSIEAKKHVVNYFFALIIQNLEFEKIKGTDSVKLIKKVLNYIHQNFKENITRKSIAQKFGYSEEHISRIFHKFLKIGISSYINDLRLDYVEKNKNISDKTTLELIFEAGFNCERTYFRAKKLNKI